MSNIILDYPITDEDGNEIKALEMRRPKVRDHIWLKTQYGSKTNPKKRTNGELYDDFDRDIAMYARLTDQPESVIAKMDMLDLGKCATTYIEFSMPSTNSEPMSEIV
ncbi:phage tail assembly protein [Vibrio proteolyticus]